MHNSCLALFSLRCWRNFRNESFFSGRGRKGGGKRGHVVAGTLFLGWANERYFCVHAAQTGKHLLRTQNVSDKNQKHFLCLGQQQMLRARANGETYVSATMCPQRIVSSFANTLRPHAAPKKHSLLKTRQLRRSI